jgi:hypothetical protein
MSINNNNNNVRLEEVAAVIDIKVNPRVRWDAGQNDSNMHPDYCICN